ncbi:hypothetical protein EVAR_79496_1 [Eumeta japonica]|uniref:Uncharacterized protein n=1 Tax=Eumeta variegata TaxID=151549 RepID=A0A4C1UEQ0_EUMVA|nr:hypothetical protein EVAR_79496_1 [Eumeta japonica]
MSSAARTRPPPGGVRVNKKRRRRAPKRGGNGIFVLSLCIYFAREATRRPAARGLLYTLLVKSKIIRCGDEQEAGIGEKEMSKKLISVDSESAKESAPGRVSHARPGAASD